MMNDYLFPVSPPPAVLVVGENRLYPVTRIFCVGRNYAEHVKEMGHSPDREAPFYFMKPASALVGSGVVIAYPPETRNYHYEMELVCAIGKAGFRVSVDAALDHVYGYACGLDMTRRDVQLAAREKGRPWDLGKAFEQSAVVGKMTRAAACGPLGGKAIRLAVNGSLKQSAKLDDLIWNVEQLVSHLSRYYHLIPGDLIFTGTPAGVGPLAVGDRVEGTIDGLDPVDVTIGPAL